ncbi:periplasmic heavy metal sensor [Nitrospirillum sp. BR 11163]|uniref:periplasmic heavy metal sensor n=1 Tax=Nitrospirillum sp. BR 11163 TaxID=3104323 RepID=UPI002AFE3886|nr:periplasmic heavy metal sensor [Nitrospirillum sp. BR 11163]MEA1674160.1 periplasmic heavy metal sensor [Nitrospirillum sp. BR 11163]
MRSPVLRFLFLLSLALNLFLLAFLGAQQWRQRTALGALPPVLARSAAGNALATLVGQLAEQLPAGDRSLLRGAIVSHMAQLEAAQGRFTAAMDQVRTEIDRTPLDPDALRAAMANAREQRQPIGPVLEDIMMEVLPKMSPEGRHVLARYRGR